MKKATSSKQQQLERLYEPYKKCLACPLGRLGRTQVVFGSGNPEARLVIIGEGPGKDEDERGTPFVGRSGKLLTKILSSVGINRDDVFITNVVKCRPPGNRAPVSAEITTCTELLLHKELAIVQPTIICTLGATALNAFFNKKMPLSEVRGTFLSTPYGIVLPTYHPAYILRSPKALPLMQEDLKKIAIKL